MNDYTVEDALYKAQTEGKCPLNILYLEIALAIFHYYFSFVYAILQVIFFMLYYIIAL